MKKPFFFLFSLFLCSIFVFSHAEAAFFDPQLKWQTVQTQHFNIHFHKGEESLAERMAEITEEVYVSLTPKLNWTPKARTEVVLTDHTDASNAFATVLPYNYILMFVASQEGTSNLNFYDDWLKDLFTHEFTHVLHIDQHGGIAKPFRWVFGKLVSPNGLTPGWVREGIAVYEESQQGKGRVNNSLSEMMLRTDILNDQFLNIDEVSGGKTGPPGGNAAYIYGGAFWQYLADTYGKEKIAEFSKRYGNSLWLFSLNHKARKTFEDKNFLKLWSEWKNSLKQKYQKQKEALSAQGLAELKTLIHVEGNLSAPTLSPDGKKLAYSKTDLHQEPEIRLKNLGSGKDTLLIQGRSTDQISFSPDGKKIVFSSIGTYKFFNQYHDLYEVEVEQPKLKALTSGKRAMDPDYSPDGKSLVYVGNKAGSTQLFLYDLATKKEKVITDAPPFTRFSNPRFSPNGKQIAVSAWMNGNRDLYVYNLEGKLTAQLTHDAAIDNEPRWSNDGKWVYFTSDRSGISNIWRMKTDVIPAKAELQKKKNVPSPLVREGHRPNGREGEKLTNVLTGLFHPQRITGTDQIIAQHYFGKGYDIVELQSSSLSLQRRGSGRGLELQTSPQSPPLQGGEAPSYKIKKYSPFTKSLLPHYLLPGFAFGDNVGIFSLATGSSDPLGRHLWAGDITYRTDAQFLGGDFSYTYNRWQVPLYLGFNDYVTSYGDLFQINQNFFEERRRAYVGARVPYNKHTLDVYYGFEHRSDDSNLPPATHPFLNLGNYAGFGAVYQYDGTHLYPASISKEGGPRIRLGLEVLDSAFGAGNRNETKIIEGDFREYLKIPGTKHHVFALRAAGGMNWGDKLFQGVFRLGSSTGEGLLNGTSPRLYSLRGLPEITFAGDRALLFSGEYRLPLYWVDRGLTTTPFFLKDLHLAFFSDLGSVFDGSPHWNEFLLGVGAELRGDFVIGYGLPITGRLGYGIIVKGRELLGNLTDPTTGSSIKNGAVILQLGTSF